MIRLYILVYFCLNLFGTVLIYLCLSLHVCAFLLKSLLVFTWLSLSVPVCYHMHLSFRVCARLQPSVYVGTCLCLSMLEFPTVSVYTCYSLCLSFYLCLCLCLLYVPVPVCISTFSPFRNSSAWLPHLSQALHGSLQAGEGKSATINQPTALLIAAYFENENCRVTWCNIRTIQAVAERLVRFSSLPPRTRN